MPKMTNYNPALWRRYDCEFCEGPLELQTVLAKINLNGYVLESVTQYKHTYTVIFKRFD